MRHLFRTIMAHMRYVCEPYRFKIVLFLDSLGVTVRAATYDEMRGPNKILAA
jgi:hypothetical protein